MNGRKSMRQTALQSTSEKSKVKGPEQFLYISRHQLEMEVKSLTIRQLGIVTDRCKVIAHSQSFFSPQINSCSALAAAFGKTSSGNATK